MSGQRHIVLIDNVMTGERDAALFDCAAGAGAVEYRAAFRLLLLVLVVLVSGCAVTQDYQRPQVDIPQGWRVEYETAADVANKAWWEQFQDPALNELIQIALKENKDIRIATARIEEFAGRLQGARSAFFPQLSYGGLVNHNYQSESLPIPQLAGGADRSSASYITSLNVGWEVDIWGRIGRATEAARADLLSAEEGRRAVILTLVSAVSSGYINLLSMDKQLLTARKTAAFRQELLRVFERKFAGGQVSGLELAQVKATYEQAAEVIPNIERQIALQENALSVLLGRNPGTITRGRELDMLLIPEVPQGIPSDLLMRRPDILQSEQNLIAANARIGVARTQYFPSISLTGLFGYSSSALSLLLQESANYWQAGGGVVGPIFAGGRIEGEVRQARAREQQLLNTYLGTIQTALREVNDSLTSLQKLRELLKIQDDRIRTLKDNFRFANNRYDAKLASYIEVVDAERNLFSEEFGYIQTQNDIFAALVNVYKAMGGGWVTEAERRVVSTAPKP